MKDGGRGLGWLRRLVSAVLGLGVNTVSESRSLGAEIARRYDQEPGTTRPLNPNDQTNHGRTRGAGHSEEQDPQDGF